jgi:hypothetical protein
VVKTLFSRVAIVLLLLAILALSYRLIGNGLARNDCRGVPVGMNCR